MTNREWLMEQMQNMSDEELADVVNGDTSNICDEVGEKCIKRATCTECKAKWLKAEHKEKPKLSEAERVILENIDKEYKWIARDKNKNLYVYTLKPVKDEYDVWDFTNEDYVNGENKELELFNHLFQFIKWEDTEAYNIEELLGE